MSKLEINDVKKYMNSLCIYSPSRNIGHISYDLNIDTNNIEIMIDRFYFCSIGLYDNGVFEVFELHHGAKLTDNGTEWITDGEIWQYCVYKSLKRAIDFALKCAKKRELPNRAIKIW